jgi:endoglucanase
MNMDYLKKLCNAYGPSGMEDEVREIIIEEIKNHCDSYRVDKVGNLIAFKKGKKDSGKKILISAHMDEVGFMICNFSKDGYAYFDEIGSVEKAVVGGKRIIIGENKVFGVVCAKAIHLQKAEERGVCIPINEMYIDIGAETEEAARAKISIGDEAVFIPNFEEFGNGFIKSKAIDDRAGCYILTELLKKDLPCDTYFAFVTCEENGLRGSTPLSFGINPDVVIVVEATTAGDIPGTPEGQECCKVREGAVISHMDNGTIYDKELFRQAIATFEEKGIKYHVKNFVAGGNDSRAYQQCSGGAKVAALSVPTRYIHSPTSVAAIEDIENTEKAVFALLETM